MSALFADPGLHPSIKVEIIGNAVLLDCADEGIAYRQRATRHGDAERTVGSMTIINKALIAFGALEAVQDLAIAPAIATFIFCPCVVVPGVATGIDLPFDRAAADHLRLGEPDLAAFHPTLRSRRPAPACDPFGHLRKADRPMKQKVFVVFAAL